MDTLTTKFGDQIKRALSLTKVSTVVTERNVYQEGQDEILPILDEMVESLMLPGSGVDGIENLEDLFAKARSGSSCLLLPEHYSNFDLSIIHSLIRSTGKQGGDIAKALITIAGMKLNEDSVVAAFAGAYTRIVICPTRSLQMLDAEKDRAEIIRLNGINRAALRVLNDIKVHGKLVLVFPSGTRYRPWDPSTKKGVREMDSYIRSFDYMCGIAINGQILHIQQTDMMNDIVCPDLIRVTVGAVHSCAEFRDKARAAAEACGIEDKKQAAVDAVMEELEILHAAAEEKRRFLLKRG